MSKFFLNFLSLKIFFKNCTILNSFFDILTLIFVMKFEHIRRNNHTTRSSHFVPISSRFSLTKKLNERIEPIVPKKYFSRFSRKFHKLKIFFFLIFVDLDPRILLQKSFVRIIKIQNWLQKINPIIQVNIIFERNFLKIKRFFGNKKRKTKISCDISSFSPNSHFPKFECNKKTHIPKHFCISNDE